MKNFIFTSKINNLVYFRYIIVVIILFISMRSYAQQYEFSASGYLTGYMGDINPSNVLYFNYIGGGVAAKYNFNPTWGVKVGFNYISVYGNDLDSKSSYQRQRALQFNNDLKELSAVGEFNFFKYIAGRKLNQYTPYLIAGVAVSMHNPYTKLDGNKIYLSALQLEYDAVSNPDTYSKIAVAIPMGFGFKYNIRGAWSIASEIIYRTSFNDNIDNVSKNYATSIPPSMVGSEDIWYRLADPRGQLSSNAGKSRGNKKNYDGYMTAGITLTYTLLSTKCYDWQ